MIARDSRLNYGFEEIYIDVTLMLDASFPILKTKLNRPKVKAGWVHRPRLLDQLNQVLEKSVAIISAPAGFGKTTILCQWLECCPLPQAWLQVEVTDSDLSVFLAGFVAALRQIFPESGSETASLLQAGLPVPFAAWKAALTSDLEALEATPFVLVLDDFHRLNNPLIDLLLSDLLLQGPSCLHLIISARRSPPLSFSRLNVQGQMAEIRTVDLRFNKAESLVLLKQAVDFPLSDAFVEQLQEKMEGWAAGLALAAISLREERDPKNLILQLDGMDRRVSDYLLDQVFNNQPPEMQEFLVKTASLDRFCVPLCQAVLEWSEGLIRIPAILERVETAQVFLTALDNQNQWYRYHHIFQQMLLQRQRSMYAPEEIEQLHRHAAKWLAGEGLFDEALDHFIAIHDWQSAARLAESRLCNQLNREDMLGIKRRLALFPKDFIPTRPGLLLMQAWLAHFNLKVALIHRLVDQIQTFIDAARQEGERDFGLPPPGFEEISLAEAQAHIRVIESAVCYLTNRSDPGAVLARQSLADLPVRWAFVRGTAMLYLGLCMQMAGNEKDAIRLLREEYEAGREQQTPYKLRLLFCLATIHFLLGDLKSCRQAADLLLGEARSAGYLLLQGWGAYLLGRVHHEWNDLEQAAAFFAAVARNRYSSNLICALDGMAGWVHVLRARGQFESAQQVLDIFIQFQQELLELPDNASLSLIAWLDLQDGDRETARRWAESIDAPAAEQAMIWFQNSHYYQARILVALGEPGTIRAAEPLLDKLQLIADRTHNTYLIVRVLALRSVWLAEQGRNSEALETLQGAAQIARPGRFMGTFLDLGPQMKDLLRQLCSRLATDSVELNYLLMILNAFPPALSESISHPPLASAGRPAMEVLLTKRELEVLKMLGERLSIKEISEKLFISTSTVRQHTQHIYRKLGINSKRQAAAAAGELGLFES